MKPPVQQSSTQKLSLFNFRLPGVSLFWIRYNGWLEDEDVLVDLRNPLQILPEALFGKPYQWKHNRSELGFDVCIKKTSEIQLQKFITSWKHLIEKIDQGHNGCKSWSKRFMACSMDGKWYRAQVIERFHLGSYLQTRINQFNLRTAAGQSKFSLTRHYSATFEIEKGCKQSRTITSSALIDLSRNRPKHVHNGSHNDCPEFKRHKPSSASFDSTQQAIPNYLTTKKIQKVEIDIGNHSCKKLTFTLFCRDVFQLLKPVTKNCLIKNWSNIVTDSFNQNTNYEGFSTCDNVDTMIRSKKYGFLCALSHNMDQPLRDQIAGFVIYKCHTSHPTAFVEIICCIISPAYRGLGLWQKMLKKLVFFATLQRYCFIAANIPVKSICESHNYDSKKKDYDCVINQVKNDALSSQYQLRSSKRSHHVISPNGTKNIVPNTSNLEKIKHMLDNGFTLAPSGFQNRKAITYFARWAVADKYMKIHMTESMQQKNIRHVLTWQML